MAARQRLLSTAVGSQALQSQQQSSNTSQSQSSYSSQHNINNLQASNHITQPPYHSTGNINKLKKPPIKHSPTNSIKHGDSAQTKAPTASKGQYGSTPTLHHQVYGGSTSNLTHSGYHGGSTSRLTRWAAADTGFAQSAPAHRVVHGVNNPGLRVNLQVTDNSVYELLDNQLRIPYQIMWPICLAFGDVDRLQQFYQDHNNLAMFPPYVFVQ